MSAKSRKSRLAQHREAAKRQPAKPNKDDVITFRGWKMTRYTAAALKVMEEELGYELTIVQGPYNTSVSQSAGTHDLDGVVDLSAYQARRKCRVARTNSWASWVRPKNWDGAGGVKHVHQVLKSAKVAPLAALQRDRDYPNHDNALASHQPDHFPWHPELERFNYAEWWHDQLLEDEIKGLNARINKTVDRLSAMRARRRLLRKRQRSN